MNDPKNEAILHLQRVANDQRKVIGALAAENEELRKTNEAYQRILAMLMSETKRTMVIDQNEFNSITTKFVFEQNLGGNVIIRYIGKENHEV